MAKVGNHGRIIPRDAELLQRLYWTENRSLVEVAAMFDVTHKSLSRVFDILGIPRRKRRTKGQSRWFKCIECEKPTLKIKHAGNGSLYGRRCRECRRQHYNMLAREYGRKPEIQRVKKVRHDRWYYQGPVNPNGEAQWLSKNKIQLRNVRRLLLNPQSLAASASRSMVSALEQSSRT